VIDIRAQDYLLCRVPQLCSVNKPAPMFSSRQFYV